MADPTTVSRDDFDARIRPLLDRGDDRLGLYGPYSVVWKVVRHTTVMLPSTALGGWMDSAHPWVAQAIVDHSKLFEKPHQRFEQTYVMLNRIVFGDLDQVRRTAGALWSRHSRIMGTLPHASGRFPAGSAYAANELDALRFVHLVYFWTRWRMYVTTVGDLPPEDWDRYVAESHRFGACFGLPEELLPRDLAELGSLMEEYAGGDRFASSEASRQILPFLTSQVPAPARPQLRAFVAETVPAPMLGALQLERTRATRLLASSVVGALRAANRVAPRSVRYVPAYHEALERIEGRPVPRGARRLNHALVGRGSVL